MVASMSLFLSLLPLSLAFTLRSAPVRPRSAVRMFTRAPTVAAGFNAHNEPDIDSVATACHLIPDNVLDNMSDLLGEGSQTLKEYHYVLCDEPNEDPSVTCFLRPENWDSELGSEPGNWVCMANPSLTRTPSMTPEDSY